MKKLYKKLFSYVQERKKYAYLSIILSAISVFVFIAFYWIFWIVVKSLIVDKNYTHALHYSFKLVILMILRGVLIMSGTMSSHYVGFRLERNLRTVGLSGLMNASFAYFDKNSSGEIRRTIDDNAANTHQTVAHLIPNTAVAILTPILMFVIAFKIDYRMGILLMITSIIGILQYKGMFKRMDLMEKSMNSLQEMSAATVEYIRGMQVIKIFGVTVKYYKSMLDSIMNYKNYTYKYSQSCRIPNITFQVLFNLFYAFCVPFAIF
ncbi:TPA: ABC transporter ATP-binding protein, partial [Streptococcus agalactiae]|nr:ABC transporter ATP-binding protein [Streptococcus agalactiae]